MFFDTRTILGYIIVALAGAPALTNAATLGDATALDSASPQDLPKPSCYRGGSSGSCIKFISDYCKQVSQISFKPGDTDHRCYSALSSGSSKYKCVLGVRNTNANQDAHPNSENCEEVMHHIASGCLYGGHGKYSKTGAFGFEIDNQSANNGVCRDFTNPP